MECPSYVHYVSSAKNLGVTITNTLNWQLHINSLLSKFYSSISTLHFHKNSIASSLRMQLVNTFVFPHFDYAALIYMDSNLTRGLDLQIFYNVCSRFVIGNIPFMPTTEVLSRDTLATETRPVIIRK